jgi:hypothetical protein
MPTLKNVPNASTNGPRLLNPLMLKKRVQSERLPLTHSRMPNFSIGGRIVVSGVALVL